MLVQVTESGTTEATVHGPDTSYVLPPALLWKMSAGQLCQDGIRRLVRSNMGDARTVVWLEAIYTAGTVASRKPVHARLSLVHQAPVGHGQGQGNDGWCSERSLR